MKKGIMVLIFLSLILSPASSLASSTEIPWDRVSYQADNATYWMQGEVMNIELENGVIYLASTIGNLTGSLEKGTKVVFNLTVEISPQTVLSGIKVVVGNDTVIHRSLGNGDHTIEFFSMRNYNATDEFLIVLYDYGGVMRVSLGSVHVEKAKGGLGEGALLTGVGISVVFLVLGILAVVMCLLKPSVKKERKREVAEKIKAGEKKIERRPEKRKVDSEVVAAITAALNYYLGGRKFRIVSVKPSPWKYYGRLKSMRRWK